MKKTHRSAVMSALVPSHRTLAALVTRNHAITQKATKRTKAQSLGNAGVLVWPRRSLISDQLQPRWMTAFSRRGLCFLRFLLWTMNSLRLPNTARLFVVAMLLASFTPVFGQPVIGTQPQS